MSGDKIVREIDTDKLQTSEVEWLWWCKGFLLNELPDNQRKEAMEKMALMRPKGVRDEA